MRIDSSVEILKVLFYALPKHAAASSPGHTCAFPGDSFCGKHRIRYFSVAEIEYPDRKHDKEGFCLFVFLLVWGFFVCSFWPTVPEGT